MNSDANTAAHLSIGQNITSTADKS